MICRSYYHRFKNHSPSHPGRDCGSWNKKRRRSRVLDSSKLQKAMAKANGLSLAAHLIEECLE
jgi:hypothetical protein